MKADSFMGGHIVTGHIDGTGKVLNIKKEDNAKLVELAIDDNLMQYMVEKGSVSLNGVSLTIYKLKEESLIVSLIPETVSETNLKDVKVGSVLNIEADIIGKYVNKMLGKMGMTDKKDDNKNSGLDKEFLKENGFL